VLPEDRAASQSCMKRWVEALNLYPSESK